MKIKIIAVGKIKVEYLRDAINEYKKRLKKFCDIEILEIAESVAKTENEANIKKVLGVEGKEILKSIVSDYVIALDINGKEYTTLELAKKFNEIKVSGKSEITFIIGGSYGLDDEVKKKADFKLSFSKLTFPHQLFRVILLEQIYRIFKIENNEPYHK